MGDVYALPTNGTSVRTSRTYVRTMVGALVAIVYHATRVRTRGRKYVRPGRSDWPSVCVCVLESGIPFCHALLVPRPTRREGDKDGQCFRQAPRRRYGRCLYCHGPRYGIRDQPYKSHRGYLLQCSASSRCHRQTSSSASSPLGSSTNGASRTLQ
jgi:hypothetical protein